MNAIWSLNIDDVLEIYERARKDGVCPGESIEKYLLEYVKEKGIKSIGMTELTKEEMITEQLSHGKSCLDIQVDKKGESKYNFIKGK